MNRLILSLSLLISVTAYTQSFDWLISAGGNKSDKGTTIANDDLGNTYITGYYNEEANFGALSTGFSFSSSKEVFVAKIDPNGNYLWVRNGLNYYDDRGLGLCLDPDGNSYVTGTCWGGLEFGPLTVYNSTSYTDQIFVTKIDPDGNVIWMKNAGVDNNGGFPYSDDHGLDLASDSQGNIFVTGFLSNTNSYNTDATFDAITIDMDQYDTLAFVAKLDNDGNWQWVETFQGIVDHRDNGITVDDEDNVYVVGGFTDTKNFGTETITSDGSIDIYVVKYDNNGNFQWVNQAGSTRKDRANAIVDGHDGYMYVAGEFRGECYFGPQFLNNYGSASKRDIFVAKISKDGNWVWARKAGSKKGSDRANSIIANNNGNIFVTGQFSSEAKFGDNEIDSSGDSIQVFVAAIDTLGEWRWVKQGGGASFDRGNGISCDNDCNLWVIGYFEDQITMETVNTAPLNGKDIFTFKMSDVCFDYTEPTEPIEPETPETCIIDVPNIFTPNNDGLNELITFTTACNIPVEVTVLNRWGQIVYKHNGDSPQWNGTSTSGEPLVEGTYFYSITTLFSDNTENKESSGFIQLVR